MITLRPRHSFKENFAPGSRHWPSSLEAATQHLSFIFRRGAKRAVRHARTTFFERLRFTLADSPAALAAFLDIFHDARPSLAITLA